mgnify:CR=1 FL=1
MAWTDWQGTSPQDAETNLAALKIARITGQPTSILVAGVKVEYDPSRTVNFTATLNELQKYLYEIAEHDYDWAARIDPYAQRPGVTTPRFW